MSFLYSWFFDMLGWLGLSYKNAKILFLGLDNAGKTTLLHLLRDGHLHQHKPTDHPTSEELTLNNLKINAWDLGGHEEAREIWRNYYSSVDAVVFLVDVSERERLPVAKVLLDSLLSDEGLAHVPFLIFGNKIDCPGATSEEELRYILGLHQTTGKQKANSNGVRPVELFMCSLVKNIGYADGLQWLSSYLK